MEKLWDPTVYFVINMR